MEAIRILHIVTYMGRGGLETTIMNYYRHMDREKVQFDFLVHRDFEADYDREIRALGGRIYNISRLIPWSSRYKQELRSFFESHREYRIVHVHQDCLSSVALKCAQECGIPVRIAHSHNSNQSIDWKYPIKRFYMKKIPAYATDLFSCAKEAGDWMFSGSAHTIMRNAIDAEAFCYHTDRAAAARSLLGIGDELLIGHVGRFRPQKNHGFLIDIFAALCKKVPHCKLLLVGDGEEEMAVRKKVQALGLEEKVLFAGSRADVNALMQAMDVFVFPSLYEGLPVTMIEAQAAGLPCVISDAISSECVITEGLVTMKSLRESVESWADCILRSAQAERKDRRQEIIAAGYDIAAEAEKLQKFYRKKYEDVKECPF